MARSDIGNDVELQKQDEGQTASPGYHTVCWGCGLHLQLPAAVPIYRCGWCGAISSENVHTRKHGCCVNYTVLLDRLLVGIIMSLMIALICGGMWAVFPVIFLENGFGFFFNLGLTGILSFNTLFNYCLAAFVKAGPVPEIPWGNVECVSQGGLDGYRFCFFCEKPKPPRAHHCRSCKACVLDMDHHCPFIGNCVGSANHRSFMLFLLFAVISSLYVFAMSMFAIVSIWRSIPVIADLVEGSSSSYVMVQLVSFIQGLIGNSIVSSVRAIALLYLLAVSLSVIIGVGLLLYQQVRQLYDGCTFIDSLQLENGYVKGITSPVRGWRNLQRVFGNGHPLYWLLPKFVVKNGKVHDK